MPEIDKFLSYRIEQSQSAIGTYPYVLQVVYIDGTYIVAGQALRIAGIVAVVFTVLSLS